MKNITIKKLSIVNFKGIKNLQIDFNANGETNIYGANASGKSSVMDAFLFCLFGKNSQDQKVFEIKNCVDTELNRQDHEVEALLCIDGRNETLKHIYRENWVKKHGSEFPEMQGHEHLYFWNDVPMQAGEYKAKVESILPEGSFKLLTNALFFNTQMKWPERRRILQDLAGDVSLEELAGGIERFQALLDELENKSLEEYKRVIVAKKATIKKSLAEISPRIDENLKNTETELDFPAIEKQISAANESLMFTESSIMDKSKAHQEALNAIQAKQQHLHNSKTALQNIEFSTRQQIQRELNEKASTLSALKSKADTIADSIKSKKALIEGKKKIEAELQQQMQELRDGWARDKAREFKFDESKFSCPTCNRDFESDDIAESKRLMQLNFDSETARLLELVNSKGLAFKKQIADNNELIATLEKSLVGLEKELEEAIACYDEANGPEQDINALVSKALASNNEYHAILNLIDTNIEETEAPVIDVSELTARKNELTATLDGLKKQLNVRDQIEATHKRINELKNQEKKLAQELAELEGKEFTIDEFSKARMDAIEERINSKFSVTRFKLFNQLINGGVEETCESLWEGVPYPSLNTASAINCGIDIINTLSKHYGFYAPIFIDGRESVTNILPTESQLINLIVSPEDTKLRVV